jgi:hypothetical protein
LSDYEKWPDQDYARWVARGEEPEEAWATFGTHFVEKVDELIEAANVSRIGVVPRATRADFAQAFASETEVVILVAHWRGSRLAGQDLLRNPETCAAAISHSAPSDLPWETMQEIRLRVSAALDDTSLKLPAPERRSRFADRLNKKVIRGSPLPGVIEPAWGEHVVVSDLWLETRHRDVLDLCAKDTIVPGNRVELRDGLHSPSSLAALVPEQWAGLIDLGMCRSVVLGHRIKQGRSDRGMIVRINTVDPTFTLTLMRRLFFELRTGTINYALRYSELFNAARQIIRQFAKK